MNVKIFLDTNILMAIGQFRVDIFSRISEACDFAHEFVTVDRVFDELNGIVEGRKGKHRDAAKLALAILSSKHLKTIETSLKKADDALLEAARLHKGIVATQDYGLRARLKAEKIPLLTMRQKKYFVLAK